MTIGTLAKLAPRIGMTLPGLREVMGRAGLLHLDENRPTQAGHVLGGAYFIEKDREGMSARFPAWTLEDMLKTLPALNPGDAVQTVFKNRYGASHALQNAAMRLRDRLPASQSAGISPLVGDSLRVTINEMKDGRERADWVYRQILPQVAELERLLADLPTESARDLAEMRGAVDWLSCRSRPRTPDIAPIRFALQAPSTRDVRQYPEAHSILVSPDEATLLERGYELNHGRPRLEDVPLSDAILRVMSRNLLAEEPERVHVAAAGMPARLTRMRGESFLLTMRDTMSGEHVMGSAHRVIRNDDRVNIRTRPDAYIFAGAGSEDVIDKQGPDLLVGRLSVLMGFDKQNKGNE